jgi:hypothetical protein
MEFLTKREIFHNGKLRSKGEIIVSGEKLDVIYPKLFVRKGAKAEAKSTEPINYIDNTQLSNNGNE